MPNYNNRSYAGIQPTRAGNADETRANAARKAIQDQQPGSEFTITIPEDLQSCLDRLEEIREEMGELYNKMYAVSVNGVSPGMGYVGPPQKVKIAIQYDLDCLSQEETLLQAQVYELQWTLPPMDENNDLEEDEREKGDTTQKIKAVGGEARDSATSTIGWPDQGR